MFVFVVRRRRRQSGTTSLLGLLGRRGHARLILAVAAVTWRGGARQKHKTAAGCDAFRSYLTQNTALPSLTSESEPAFHG